MSNPQHVDDELFAALRTAIDSVNDEDAFQSMTAVNRGEFTRFVTDEVENPKFLTKPSAFDLSGATRALNTCAAVVEQSNAPEVVVQLYRAKLKNQQLRFELLDALVAVDDERFSATSKQIYGSPNRHYFSQIVHYTLQSEPATPVAEQALQCLTDALNHVAKPKEPLPVDMLPPLRQVDTAALQSAEVAELFAVTLAESGMSDWSVVVDTTGSRTRFSVQSSRHIVYVPNDECLARRPRPLTRLAAEAIAAHEIGVHARRAHEGASRPLQLLALGLDGYLRGEEGLASYEQQQVEGADMFYGQDRYLAVALALGLDGEPRDFRSVFVLMRAYYQLHNGDEDPQSMMTLQQAWEVCRRVFRGTTGQSVGCAYTRDLAYFEGNIGTWEYLIAHPERHPHLFIGKFDPLNKRHITSLQTLEILPQW